MWSPSPPRSWTSSTSCGSFAPETTTLVFWYPTLDFDGKRSSKWKKFLKQAEERGTVALCGRRSQHELLRFLAREAEKAGLRPAPAQAAQSCWNTRART